MKLAKIIKFTIVAVVFLAAIIIAPLTLINYNNNTAQAAEISNSNQQKSSDMEFKNLIDSSYAAWNTNNPDSLSKFYAKDADLIFYDALPLQYQSWTDYKTGIQKNLFDKTIKFTLTPNDDVRTTRKGNIAWTTFTWHLDAQLNNGTPIKADGRQTDIWEKRDGKWLILHEHISAPSSL